MYNVVIIGAGQIGSRHLQSLKSIKSPSNVWVLDNSKDSLEIAAQRYDSVNVASSNAIVYYTTKMDDLPRSIDVLFITTGSGPRFSVFKTITSYADVKYIIFEKVLFQNPVHYEETFKILKNKNIKAWVNCNNRTFKFYKDIKYAMPASPILMTVSGGNWGLGCNAIHYIDLMAYLCDQYEYSVNLAGLDRRVCASKRPGYKEFFGVMRLDFKDGSQMIIHCNENDTKRLLSISSNIGHIVFDESTMKEWTTIDNLSNVQQYNIPYQSQLSASLVDSILEDGICDLPTYEQSMKLHLPLIEGLINFMNNECGCNTDNCPIT